MRRHGTFGMVAAGVILSACATVGHQTVPGNTGDIEIPAHVLRDLDAAWPGARLATSGTSCPGNTVAAPAALVADINGDGMSDLVVRADREGGSRVYAALDRVADEHDLWRVTAGDEPMPAATLSVVNRGTRFYREGSGLEEFLGVDTIVLNLCDGSRIAYLWSGDGFEPVRLAKGPAGTPLVLPTSEADAK